MKGVNINSIILHQTATTKSVSHEDLYVYTSVVVLFDLCFGVEFLCCLNLMYVFIVKLVFFPPQFLELEFLSDCFFS